VCASAGHNLEALLAAHGSGAVATSASGEVILNIDVGGGTTKFALCAGGRVLATMAIWGGARLLVLDAGGRVQRLEPALADVASALGLPIAVGVVLEPPDLDSLSDAIAKRIVGVAQGDLDGVVPLAGSLPLDAGFDRVILSGGVAEYLRASPGSDDSDDLGDLGPRLAAALHRRVDALSVPVEVASESIRATVIGASQFSMQLSGNTIHLSGPIQLPVHNIPVVTIDLNGAAIEAGADEIADSIKRRAAQLDLTDRDESVAVAIDWRGEPRYPFLRSIAEGVVNAHRRSKRRESPLIVVLDADVGASLGAIIRDELGVECGIMAIDGVELADLDFIDVGEHLLPANVVPVVIKSLVFPHGAAERPRILGSA
jgi:ethanolamine utilization protein EutA